MKISLCLPVAIRAHETQRAAMLVECLESILAQKHQNYELIVKDAFPGESVKFHDNVRQTLRKFGPKVNYIAIADDGIFNGLNQALWWATGDILHFICGDDLAGDSDTFSFIDSQFAGKTEPAWMYGSLGTVLEDGSEGHWGITPFATLDEILIHNRMGQPAVFWNRAMFERLGYFQYTMAGDYDYWCRCYRTCAPMYTERLLAVGRRWNQSASHVNKDVTEREASEIATKHSAAHARGDAPVFVPYGK